MDSEGRILEMPRNQWRRLATEELAFVLSLDRLNLNSAFGCSQPSSRSENSTNGSVLLKGVAHLDGVAAQDGQCAETFLRLGHLNLLLGDYARALSAYQRHLHLREENDRENGHAPFLFGLGLVYFHFHKSIWAYKVFSNLLAQYPSFDRRLDVLVRIAHVQRMSGDMSESSKYLHAALNDPNGTTASRSEVLFHLAYLDEQKGELAKAHNQYMSLASGIAGIPQPIRACALRQLGWLHHMLARSHGSGPDNIRNNDLALRYLESARTLYRDEGHTMYYISRVLASQGKIIEAFKACRCSISENNLNPNAWCSIGSLYHQQHQYKDALQAYTCALQINPCLGAGWLNLGMLYEQNKQSPDALICYQHALEAGGPNEALLQRMLQLRRHPVEQQNPQSLQRLHSVSHALATPIKMQLVGQTAPASQTSLLQATHNQRFGLVNGLSLNAATDMMPTGHLPPGVVNPMSLQHPMTASAVCSNSSLPVSSCAASNVGGSKRKAKSLVAEKRQQKKIDTDLLLSSSSTQATPSSSYSGLASCAGAVGRSVQQELHAASAGAAQAMAGGVTNGMPDSHLQTNCRFSPSAQQPRHCLPSNHPMTNGLSSNAAGLAVGGSQPVASRSSTSHFDGFFASNGLPHPASTRTSQLPPSDSVWPGTLPINRTRSDMSFPSPSMDFIKSLDGYLNSDLTSAMSQNFPDELIGPIGRSSMSMSMAGVGAHSQSSDKSGSGQRHSSASPMNSHPQSPQGAAASPIMTPRGRNRQSSASQSPHGPTLTNHSAAAASPSHNNSGAHAIGFSSPEAGPRTHAIGFSSPESRICGDVPSVHNSLTDNRRQASQHNQSLKMRTSDFEPNRRPSSITDVLSPTLLTAQPRNGFTMNHSERVVLKGKDLWPGYTTDSVSSLSHEYMITSPRFIPPRMPPVADDVCLNPEVPIVEVNSLAEAHSAELRHLCLHVEHPIVLIKNCAASCQINVDLFTSQYLSDHFNEHPMELRTQKFQEPEVNIEATSKRKGWRYHSSRSAMSIGKYNEYQRSAQIEACEEAQERRLEAVMLAAEQGVDPQTIKPKKKKTNKMVKFGTNGDLSDENVFALLLAEVAKLPEFLKVASPENILSYVGHTVLGMNSVQLYMKVPGCRTPAHQENNNFCSVNINIGPGDCEWFAVANKYWGLMHRMCERRRLCFLTGSWWPLLDDLREAKIPVYRFTQKVGDIVWVNTGCVHWVQSVGFCNNVAWNVGPLSAHQYRMSMERYRWNKVQSVKSIVPMIQVTWNLARFVPIREPELHSQMKKIMETSMKQLTKTKERLVKEKVEIKWHGHEKNEATYYCRKCEVEVFNFLFTTQLDDKHVVFCEDCARAADSSLLTYSVLQQFELEDLQTVRDHFHLQPATPPPDSNSSTEKDQLCPESPMGSQLPSTVVSATS